VLPSIKNLNSLKIKNYGHEILLLLSPPGGIAIRRVCWFTGSLVGWFVRLLTSSQRLHWLENVRRGRAGDGQARGRRAGEINTALALRGPGGDWRTASAF